MLGAEAGVKSAKFKLQAPEIANDAVLNERGRPRAGGQLSFVRRSLRRQSFPSGTTLCE